MLKASSTIDHSIPDRVTVTTEVTLSYATAVELYTANGGTAPKFDLGSVVYAVAGSNSGYAPNVPANLRTVFSGAIYQVALSIRAGGASVGFLAAEAHALAPQLVLALETLLYDMVADARTTNIEPPAVSADARFSWGAGRRCAQSGSANTYQSPAGTTHQNTSRVTWRVSFSADGSSLPAVIYTFESGEGEDTSMMDNPDPTATGPDTQLRRFPGNWDGNVAGVRGLDTRICHTYVTGARIKRGSTIAGSPNICQLDLRYATTRRYNMVYASLRSDDPIFTDPTMTGSERTARIVEIDASFSTDGGSTPVGPPFYDDSIQPGNPLNLFGVPDNYLAARAVVDGGYAGPKPPIPAVSDDGPYNPPGVYDADDNYVEYRKYRQKLVLNGDAWDPIATLDMQRLATALFYPPQQYAFNGLKATAAGSNKVSTELNLAGAPVLDAWRLLYPGIGVNSDGDMLGAVFVPATWHEVNGYGLELLDVVPWMFKAPSSVSRTYPATGTPANWYNLGEPFAALSNLYLHTVTARPERTPIPVGGVIVTGREEFVPIVATNTEHPAALDVPYQVEDELGVRPGIVPGATLTPASTVPLLREGQPFDILLKFTQHRVQVFTVVSNEAVGGDPYWGPTTVEVMVSASQCSVNCAGS